MDVSAFLIQAIAHISGNTIDCSSMPDLFDGMKLGDPKDIEPNGTRMWASLKIPPLKDKTYFILEKHDYAAVFVAHQVLEALGNPEMSVGVFNIKTHLIYTTKGQIKPEWIESYKGITPISFIDSTGRYIVHIAPNNTNLSAVVAAMPIAEISGEIRAYAKMLIPMGILLGLGLAGIFLFLAKRQYSVKTELLNALDHNEFYLEYQPIIALSSQSCVGAEALIRWRHPSGTNVRPDLFIPLAEETGVITLLTKKVFELIARDIGEILRHHPQFHIGINISSLDLQSDEVLNFIKTLTKDARINEDQIILEATERGFLNDGVAQGLMKEIRSMGVKIAIDDFGTGYSSLSYLTKFDLDYLKIDKTFVDAVGTEAVTGHVAFHIIEMAKSLNLMMIAEGVETENQAGVLLERGVTYVQGWLYAKSLSPKDLLAYLKDHP